MTRILRLGLLVGALGCALGGSIVGGRSPDAGASDDAVADLGHPDAPDDAPALDLGPADDVPLDAPDVPAFGRAVLPGPSRSSAVAVSADDRVAVAVNRAAHSVSVFALTPGPALAAARVAEVSTGDGSEPWSVALAPDDATAYVALHRDGQLVRIDHLRETPSLFATRAAVGSEPTGVALSPSGRTVFVASWGEGTVSVVDAATLAVTSTIDLNAALVRGGFLGAGAAARAGLAHPRALAVTNDGDADDADESLYVTEFFSQRRTTPGPGGLERFDQDHVGVVFRYTLGARALETSVIAPVADLGFRGTDGAVAGCFADQLSSLAVASGRVYVTALCASPRGPVGPGPSTDSAALNFRTQHTGAILVLDQSTGFELPSQRVLLNARFRALYEARRTPDDAARRYPLMPVDMVFQPLVAGSTAGSTATSRW